MKKFLLILLFLFLFAGIALAVFIVTFDANQFRPLVVDRLEAALGKPVQLEKISLGWHDGLALELTGLAIFADERNSSELVRFPSASIKVQLGPLLHKAIEVSSLILNEPVIHLIKGPDGQIKGLGGKTENAAPPAPGTPAQTAPSESVGTKEKVAASAVSFIVSRIKIEGGEFIFEDQSGSVPMTIHLKQIDLTLSDVSLIHPIPIKGRLAAFSDSQNFQFTGEVHYSAKEEVAILQHGSAKLDLASIKVKDLVNAFPDLANVLLIKDTLRGSVTLELPLLKMNPEGFRDFESTLSVQNAQLDLATLNAPVEDLNVDIRKLGDQIQLYRLSSKYAGGRVSGSGTINQFSTRPLTAFEIAIQDLDLQNVLPPSARQEDPRVQGILSVAFQGTAQGKEWPLISQTLSGKGQLNLKDAAVRNLNLLKEVFNRLSMIPGLVKNLNERLPESYQEKLNARDTILNPVELPFAMNQGVLAFDNLYLTTDSFELRGAGHIGVGGGVRIQAALIIDPELSEALVRSVAELQTLANQDGKLQVPLNIQGIAPNISVVPDIQYVASKLAASQLSQWLGPKTVQNGDPSQSPIDPNAPPSNVASDPNAPQEPANPYRKLTGRKIFDQLLQSALQGQDQGQDSSAPTNQ